jgi:hypothetical protein
VRLQVNQIDSSRMVLHLQQAKGNKPPSVKYLHSDMIVALC